MDPLVLGLAATLLAVDGVEVGRARGRGRTGGCRRGGPPMERIGSGLVGPAGEPA
jgi:hypothetical protein